jgi:multiple sugar transport system permease protein
MRPDRVRSARRHKRFRRGTAYWVAWSVVGLAIFLTLFPIYWLFTISSKTQRDAFATPPAFIYRPIFGAYREIWQAAGFGHAFVNSVVVVSMGVALALVLSVPAAYALARFRTKWRKPLAVWLLLAYMLPEFLFVIPMYVLYQQFHLYDTTIGLALMYQVFGIPLAVWILQSFLGEVPKELGEAAEIDGATHLQTLIRVYLPVIAPGLAATAILLAIYMWNELTMALSLTFERAKTVTVAVAGFRGYAAIKWDQMAAASIVAIAPMVLFASIVQRHIVKGLTLGAVK